jgi:hypothetical protein
MPTRDELIALLRAAADMLEVLPIEAPGPVLIAGPQQLVTLSQCAAMVLCSKRTLYNRPDKPAPVCSSRNGSAALYDWATMRPWLEKEFGILLPDKHPSY